MTPRAKETNSDIFDERLGTILPSYSMYASTLGLDASVAESGQDQDVPPPNYDFTSVPTAPTAPTTMPSTPTSLTSPTTPAYSNGLMLTPNLSHSSLPNSQSTSPILRPQSPERGNSNSLVPVLLAPALGRSGTPLIVTDQYSWKETILDNAHRIPNLTFEDHEISRSVVIKIYYTKDIGEIGKEPEIIDPSLYEFKQGDLLNGFITIQNTSDKRIPFDMFYLLFEGNFMVANSADAKDTVPKKIHRFLEMFDFSGSWNTGYINRLKSETRSVHYGADDNPRDPRDGSYLFFVPKREILPNRIYKRFFSFRIPRNLLDTVCNEHNLSRHMELPPTLGLSRWETAHCPEKERTRLRDFSILNSSISYGAMARFIGRKLKWEKEFGKFKVPKTRFNAKLVNPIGDEYVILKELTNFVRVVAESNSPSELEKLMKKVENKLLYDNLIKQADEKIELGHRLIKALKNTKAEFNFKAGQEMTQEEIDLAKVRQSYKREVDTARSSKSGIFSNKDTEYYEMFVPIIKKHLTGAKNMGVLQVKTPKIEYHISYIPPPNFREDVDLNLARDWNLSIPIEMVVTSRSLTEKSFKPPTIKEINAEFVVHTISSMNYPIGLEFNHDLVYNKVPHNYKEYEDKDTFKKNIVQPIKKQLEELHTISHVLGSERFRMNKQLLHDLTSISELEEKVMKLSVLNCKVNGKNFKNENLPWVIKKEPQLNTITAKASFDFNVNLEKLTLKGSSSNPETKSFNTMSLVPNFQACYMCRFYHINIKIHLSGGDCARLKVPVFIDKT